MFEANYQKSFLKDVQKCKKRNYDLKLLYDAVNALVKQGKVPEEMNPHPLKGEFADYMECHVDSDWLLVWKQDNKRKKMSFHKTGTHADLF